MEVNRACINNSSINSKNNRESLKMETVSTYHLVRSEDLNHHNTLFAGRFAEWLIETGFITAARTLDDNNVVVAKIHEINYLAPGHVGDILRLEGKAVYAGHTSIGVYISGQIKDVEVINGTISFVLLDEYGSPRPHGISIEAMTDKERELGEKIRSFVRK